MFDSHLKLIETDKRVAAVQPRGYRRRAGPACSAADKRIWINSKDEWLQWNPTQTTNSIWTWDVNGRKIPFRNAVLTEVILFYCRLF